MIEEDQKKPRRIMVIGDGMTDVYVCGELTTCQDDCPKFMEKTRVRVPGGSLNAARSLNNWLARRMCVYPAGRGPVKTRYMVRNECVFRHDDDRVDIDLDDLRRDIRETFDAFNPEGVLISDYDKGLMTPQFLREVISRCSERQVPCVADMKRHPSLYRGAILKCNEEYQHRYNRELSDSVWESTQPDSLVVTSGPLTPAVWEKGEIKKGFKFLPPVQCVNHVGAGDCFAAHLTLALVCGLSLKDAAVVAHSAGRVYVQHVHNRPPTREEIVADLTT